ncbi:unnamed protein product [marine sediment metagenome]|uniref:Uncharacterized protein n=1 Tax=marine sediment metagenome TaxID=412755 RepID=X1S6N1_9ZZZZ
MKEWGIPVRPKTTPRTERHSAKRTATITQKNLKTLEQIKDLPQRELYLEDSVSDIDCHRLSRDDAQAELAQGGYEAAELSFKANGIGLEVTDIVGVSISGY